MSRDRTHYLLSRSIDGDLDAQEQAQLHAAVLADPSLLELQADFSRVDQVLRDTLPVVDFDENMLCQSIMASIEGPLMEQETAPLHRIRPWWNQPALRYAAMVAITATAALAVWPSGNPASVTPQPAGIEVIVNNSAITTHGMDQAEPVTEVIVSAPPPLTRPAPAQPVLTAPDLGKEAPAVTLATEETMRKGSIR